MRRRVGMVGALVLAQALAAGAAARAQSAEPLWTDAPTRVDRGHQSYERLPAKPAPPPQIDPFPLRLDTLTPNRALDSITFRRGKVRYRLAGLEPVPAGKTCADGDGARWACGLRARAALSELISGRRLRCAPRGNADAATLVDCVVNKADLGQSLVASGNAYVGISGGRYEADEERARRARLGIWAAVEAGP